MDIRTLLLSEHSKENAEAIMYMAIEDNSVLEELLSLFAEDNYRLIQRASWPLTMISDKRPYVLRNYRTEIVDHLFSNSENDSAVRNILRIFQHMRLPEDRWEKAIDFCYKKLESPGTSVAIKVFSMQILYDELIAEGHYELLPDLAAIIEDYMPHGSPGYKSKGKKILRAIKDEYM